MSKLITVFGATGNQGGSVITSILNDPILSEEFKIRGITRDISKPAAQALAARGVEVVAVRSFLLRIPIPFTFCNSKTLQFCHPSPLLPLTTHPPTHPPIY